MNISCNLKCDYIHLIRFSQYSLDKIASFEFSTNLGIDLLQPYYQDVFNSDVAEQLESIYKLLYPNYNVSSISRFYRKFGHATIAGDLIGSHLPGQNSRTSSVVMAYWPSTTRTSLLNIDYSRMQVGVVQYFISHILQYREMNVEKREEHVFAYVKWKKRHPHYDWFGLSATVCINSYESETCFSMLPIQRIARRCATIVLPIDFGDLSETVLLPAPFH